MNTNMVYNLKFYIRETNSRIIVENIKIEEEVYSYLLDKLETNRFITIINENQDPITINVGDIHRIETTIEMQEI